MKKTNFALIIFAVLAFGLTGDLLGQTSKTSSDSKMNPAMERNQEKMTNRNSSSNISEWSVVSNKDNPFDEAGLKHNQIVDEFLKSEDFRSLKKSKFESSSMAIKNFFGSCCEKNKYCCGGNGPYNPFPDLLDLVKIVQTEKTPEKILTKFKTSRQVENYAKEILSLVRALPKKEYTRTTFNKFFVLEKRIVNDRKLTKEDRRNALTISAVARYSAFYWKKQSTENPDISSASFKIDWDEVAAVDAICGGLGPEAAAVGSLADLIAQLASSE